MNRLIQKIRFLLDSGHERTARLKKNILGAFLVKGGIILVNLMLVPLTVNYLTPSKYGVWLTLSSIVSWASMFDIGLGHGLRNRFAEAIANGNKSLARIYVSTTYVLMAIILLPVLLGFCVSNIFLDWSVILNTSREISDELKLLALIIFCLFCIQLIVQLIATILTANQQPARASFISFVSNFISFLAIFALTKLTNGSLLYLGVAVSLSPILVFSVFSIWLFRTEYNDYAPSLKFVRFQYTGKLAGLGIKFLFIQISGVVIYSTSNILISQLGSPLDVTSYNIAYKYFTSAMMIFTILLGPIWSAVTEAYNKNDMEWIQSVMKKIIYSWLILVAATVIMLIAADFVYRIWVGKNLAVPFGLSFWLSVFVVFYCWDSIFVFFLNGIGKIKLQLYASVVGCIVFIPLSIIFAKYLNIGFIGVAIASVVLVVLNAFWMPVQYLKIIKKTATGIWAQ